MSKPIDQLLNKLPKKDLESAHKKANKTIKALALQELRQAKKINQQQMAHILDTKQANISRLERRSDMHISTLRNYIQALGGELIITANFPQEKIQLSQFSSTEQNRPDKNKDNF